MGEVATALIPFRDDFLVFGCNSSIWVLRGDPVASDGEIEALSRVIGVVGPNAWCQGPLGEVYVLGPSGFYQIDPGANAIRDPFSSEIVHARTSQTIPRELQNLSMRTHEICLGWSEEEEGVHIYAKPLDATGADEMRHWFWDLRTRSLWRDTHTCDHTPTARHFYATDFVDYRALVLGGTDGYLRHYDYAYHTDDGSAFDSYVFYTPVRLAGNDYAEGKLLELVGTVGNLSGQLDWQVRVGRSHKEAIDAATFESGSWNSFGRNHTARPRARGGSCVLRLSNGETLPWSIETLHGTIVPAGRTRKA